jgi:hypothetical protein
MNNKLKSLTFVLAAAAASVMISCNGEGEVKTKTEANAIEDGARESRRKENIKVILHTVPTPMSTSSLIKAAGADFNGDLMNPIENANRYNSATKQAIALGVYGADLSYASMFDKEQESVMYLSATQKMCSGLGIEGALDKDLFSRMNAHKENRDSVIAIVSDTYYSLDTYLKEIGREDLLALVITGGWVEGLYLAGSHAKGNPGLIERIAEQKYSAKSLMDLLDTYTDAPHLSDTRDAIAGILKLFDKIAVTDSPTTTTTDANGSVVIGGGGGLKYSQADIDAIIAAVNELRAEYIK